MAAMRTKMALLFLIAVATMLFGSYASRKQDHPEESTELTPAKLLREDPLRDQESFLPLFVEAVNKLPRPELGPRDPRNPQRMIIDRFVAEQNGVVSGRCLEFDEDLFMKRSGRCEHREILKYKQGTRSRSSAGGNSHRTHGDLLRADVYPDGFIDVTFFTEVLEHIVRPDLAAAALFRITAPCGMVILTTPFIYMFHADPVDFLRYTDMAVKSIFAEAGFTAKVGPQRRGDIVTVVAAAMRLHGKAIPEANLHLDKKGDAMASAIVAVFQKPGKGGQACAALPAPLLPGPGKEWKQREMQMQQRPATHSEQRAPGSAKGSVTLVAIGYDVTRAQNLTEIITKYLAMEIVAAVILIWNNLAVPVPKSLLALQGIAMRFTVLKPTVNSLSNRYGPEVQALVKSPLVLIADDDLQLEESAIGAMVAAFVDGDTPRVAGLCPRSIARNKYIFKAQYGTEDPAEPYALVAGRIMVFPRELLAWYSNAPVELLREVENEGKCGHCDDILFQALVSNRTRRGPLVPAMQGGIRDLPEPGSLSLRPGWRSKRDDCVGFLQQWFSSEHGAVSESENNIKPFVNELRLK